VSVVVLVLAFSAVHNYLQLICQLYCMILNESIICMEHFSSCNMNFTVKYKSSKLLCQCDSFLGQKSLFSLIKPI